MKKKFKHKLLLFGRGVKQAGFLVLYKTAMPGVLIETGFISNSKDEKFLLSEKGQNQVALAIFKALHEYKSKVERREIPLNNLVEKPVAVVEEPVGKEEPATVNTTGNPPLQDDKVWYRVQFASSEVDKSVDSPEFRDLPEVKKYFQNGLYKFTSGNFASFKEASVFRTEINRKCFKDAFVVPF